MCYIKQIIISYWSRGGAKYRDFPPGEQRQIIDQRLTDKSRYFARTEFNNCFIIHLHSFVLCFLRCFFCLSLQDNSYLPNVQQSNRHCMFEGNAPAQSIICSLGTFLTNAHAQTISRTLLFAGKLTNQNLMNNNFIFHLMKIFLPLYGGKHSLFVY